MIDILLDDVGFTVFIVSAVAVLVAVAAWIYGPITSLGLVVATFVFASAALGGLFLHLFDATLAKETH